MNLFKSFLISIATIFLFGASTNSYAINGRVMIFAFDNNELKILLAEQGSYWNDWGTKDTDVTKLFTFQQKLTQELKLQAVSPQCEEMVTLDDGTLVYAKEVSFKPGRSIFSYANKAKDSSIKKNDIKWISIKEISNINPTSPTKFGKKQLEVSRGITNNINYVLTQANIQKASQGEHFPSTSTVVASTMTSTGASSINPMPLPTHIPTPAIPAGTQVTFGQAPILTHHIAPITANWSDRTFIRFYDASNPYYEFTNFYAKPQNQYLFSDTTGRPWYTSEQYYQAFKFDEKSQEFSQIRTLTTPRQAFDYAQAKRAIQRPDWQNISLWVMLDALLLKFNNNDNLKTLLLGTRGKVLVEDAGAKDNFFGAGADYNGKNHLGRMLMFVRSKLERGINLAILVGNPTLIHEYQTIPEGPAGIIAYCGNIH